ncbi:MAG: cardiolipin synthase [Faecalibacterium sp.]|jgi:cardiolipin synthase|nr:cardiolipin synthase [Faecalibacterium sp.]
MHTTTGEKRENIQNSISRGVFVALSILLQVFWIVGFAMYMAKYYAVISLAASLLSLLIVLRIYGEHINSAYKVSWIILIMAFPIFGLCLFLLFGREGSAALSRRRFARVKAALAGCLVQDPAAVEALQHKDKGLANQSHYLGAYAGFPVYADTDVTYYGDTSAALAAQKADLETAQHFIFMEYHAIQDSTAWHGIEDILVCKAKAGVDVRVFYDDMGSIGFVSKPFVRRLQSEGIQCRVFNPLLPVLNVFMNNRDHRKITVIDGRVGYTGGYNLADEYFNLTRPYGRWKDSGIRLAGGAVRSLTVIFLEMWAATQKEPLDPAPFLPEVSHSCAEPGCFVQPYSDSPLDEEGTGENAYMNLIKNARRSVYITTPYLIISDEMHRELTLAAKRGVDVRIVTPGIPDKKLIYKVTRSYYAGLAQRGVRIYEYTPGFLHAKQFVCDDEVAIVGTINMDFRSLYLHFENACWFCGCHAVQDVRQDFEDLFAASREVTADYSGKRSLALRGMQCILRLFSPLM